MSNVRSNIGPAAGPLNLSWALRSCRDACIGIGLISALLNVLYLTGSFFMLEVYDRVLPSRSLPTLAGLALLAGSLYVFQAILDVIRGRVLARIGLWLDENLSQRVYDILVRGPLKTRGSGDGLQPLRDLDQVRAFLSSLGPTALFDLPWMPFYLAICFLFHPMIGWTAVAGALVLVTLALLTDLRSRAPAKETASLGATRNALADASRRNAEVLQAMGMTGRFAALWGESNTQYRTGQLQASDIVGGLGSISKVVRIAIQSAVLGVGGYLVIKQEATAGIIIAGAILTSRAFAPVELAIAHWKGFVAARQSWERLQKLVAYFPQQKKPIALPAPHRDLALEAICVTPPGEQRLVVHDVSLTLKTGQGLGIIGPSASGKSSLVRAMVGVWSPVRGKVRIDGAAFEHWDADALGRHIGYLPQDVELFSGTVAQNIARFEISPAAERVLAAAQAAAVHDLILRLPDGYETEIGEGGAMLSAGQRQRLALARALYGDPFLVVLDEPNSNLDADGERALTRAIMAVRARGGIVVVVTHQSTALAGVDQLLVMTDGGVQALGPKDQIMNKLLHPQDAQPTPLKKVGAEGKKA